MTIQATEHSGEQAPEKRRLLGSLDFSRMRDLGILTAVVALFVALSVGSPGFDLSTGAMYVVAGIAAVGAANTVSAPIGVLAGLLVGAGLGAINGVLGTFGRMNVFVATLATSIVFTGAAIAVTGGTVLIASNTEYAFALQRPLGVSIPVWCFLATIVGTSLLFRRTTLGRYLYATGGNEDAARLAGVRTHPVRLFAFTFAGLCAGLGAVLVSSGSLSAGTSSGTSVAYSVWTALLIGGNSMSGGEGAVWRTVAGVALLALLQNGFNLLGVEPLYQQVATGVILLLAIGLDAWARSTR
jgi:ribose transport system permease protein